MARISGCHHTSFHVLLFLTYLRQLIVRIDSPVCSFQRKQCRPFRQLQQITASYTRLTVSSSIWTTWPSQPSRWMLIHCTTSMWLRSSCSSLLNQMHKLSFTGPRILRRTFISRIFPRWLYQRLILFMPLRHEEAHFGHTREISAT